MKAYWENVGKTIIRFTLERGWTWNDLHAVLDRTEHYAELAGTRIDAIVDTSEVEPARTGQLMTLAMIDTAREFARRAAQIDYAVIIVGASNYFRATFQTHHLAFTDGRQRVHFASSIEVAHELLQRDQLRHVLDTVCASDSLTLGA